MSYDRDAERRLIDSILYRYEDLLYGSAWAEIDDVLREFTLTISHDGPLKEYEIVLGLTHLTAGLCAGSKFAGGYDSLYTFLRNKLIEARGEAEADSVLSGLERRRRAP